MSVKEKVMVFLCTEFMGVEDQIVFLSEILKKFNLRLLVVTDSENTSTTLQKKKVIETCNNVRFLGNDRNLFENQTNLNLTEEIYSKFLSSNSYLNLLSVDYDRFDYLGLSNPLKSNLHNTFKDYIKLFQYLHFHYDVISSFSEGPHNFFLRVYDFYRGETKNIGRYIYLRPGRVGDCFYLQDADTKETVLGGDFTINNSKDLNPSYMQKDAPLIRTFLWKLKNFHKTSIFQTFLKIFYTKNLKLSSFDRPNIISLVIALWRREIRSYFFSISGKNNSFITEAIPDGKLVIYPEHYHPEASTSAYDFSLRNDYENALRIRRALPEEFKFIYKLHPSNKRRHSKGFLKKISQIPGVLLVEKFIIDKNPFPELIISVSSTLILDFIEKCKPVIVIGNPEFCQDKYLSSLFSKTTIENFEKDPLKIIYDAEKKVGNSKNNFMRESLVGSLYTPKKNMKNVISNLIDKSQK